MGNSQQNTSGSQNTRHMDFEEDQRSMSVQSLSKHASSLCITSHLYYFKGLKPSQNQINSRNTVENSKISIHNIQNSETAAKSKRSASKEFRINIDNLQVALNSNKKVLKTDESIRNEESNSYHDDPRFSNTGNNSLYIVCALFAKVEIESVAEEKLIEEPNKQHMSPTKIRQQKASKHRIRLSTGRSSSVRRDSLSDNLATQQEFPETETSKNRENDDIGSKLENQYYYPPQSIQSSACKLGPLSKDVIRISGISSIYKKSASKTNVLASKNNPNNSNQPITLVFKKHMLNDDSSNTNNQTDLSIAIMEERQKLDRFHYKDQDEVAQKSKMQINELQNDKNYSCSKQSDRVATFEQAEEYTSQDVHNYKDDMKEPSKNAAYHNKGQIPDFPNNNRNSETSIPSELHSSQCSRNSEPYNRNVSPQMEVKQNNLKSLDEKAPRRMRDLNDSSLPIHYYTDETFKNNYFDAYIEGNSGGRKNSESQSDTSQNVLNMKLRLGNLNESGMNPETELTPRENDRISVNTQELTAFFLNRSQPISENSQLNNTQNDAKSGDRSCFTDRSDPLSSSRINSMVSTARNSTHRGTIPQNPYIKNNSLNGNASPEKEAVPKDHQNNIQTPFQERNNIQDEPKQTVAKVESPKSRENLRTEKFVLEKPGDLVGNSGVHMFLKSGPQNNPLLKFPSQENTQNGQELAFNRKITPTFSLNESQDQQIDDFLDDVPSKNLFVSVNSSGLFTDMIAQKNFSDSREAPKTNNIIEKDISINKTISHNHQNEFKGVDLRTNIESWEKNVFQQREIVEDNKINFNIDHTVETGTFGSNVEEAKSVIQINSHFFVESSVNQKIKNSSLQSNLNGANMLNNIQNSQKSSNLVKQARFRPREDFSKNPPENHSTNQINQGYLNQNSASSNSSVFLVNFTAPLAEADSNISQSSSFKIQNKSTSGRYHLCLNERSISNIEILVDEADLGKSSSKNSQASYDIEPLGESGIQQDYRDPSSELGQHRASFYLDVISEKSSPKRLTSPAFKAANDFKELNSEPPQQYYRSIGPTHQVPRKNYASETEETMQTENMKSSPGVKLTLKTTASSNHDILNGSNHLDTLVNNKLNIAYKEEIKPIEKLQETRQKHVSVQTESDTKREELSGNQPRKMFETYQEWAAYKNKASSENNPDSTLPNSQRSAETVSAKEGSMNVISSNVPCSDRESVAGNLKEDCHKQNFTELTLQVLEQIVYNPNRADKSTHVRPSPKAEPFSRISVAIPIQNENLNTSSKVKSPERNVKLEFSPSKLYSQPQTERNGSRENIFMLPEQPQNVKKEWRSKSLAEQKSAGKSLLYTFKNPSRTSRSYRSVLFSPESPENRLYNSPCDSLRNISRSISRHERSPADDYYTLTQSKVEPSISKSERRHSNHEASTIQFSIEEPALMSMLSELDHKHLGVLIPEPQNTLLIPTPKPLKVSNHHHQSETLPLSKALYIPVSENKRQSQPSVFKVQPISDYERILQKAMKKKTTKTQTGPKRTSNNDVAGSKNKQLRSAIQEPLRSMDQQQILAQNESQTPQRALPIDDYILNTEQSRKNSVKAGQKSLITQNYTAASSTDRHYINQNIHKEEEYSYAEVLRSQGKVPQSFEILSSKQADSNIRDSNDFKARGRRCDTGTKYSNTLQLNEDASIFKIDKDSNKSSLFLGNDELSVDEQDQLFGLKFKNTSNYRLTRESDKEQRINRDLNHNFRGINVYSLSKAIVQDESPFEREPRRQIQANDSDRPRSNFSTNHLLATPGKKVLQLKGQLILNDNQGQAYASLIFDNLYQSPMTAGRKINQNSAGRIRKNFMRDEYERFPRSSSAERYNYNYAAITDTAMRYQRQSYPDWMVQKDEVNYNYLQDQDSPTKSFRLGIDRVKKDTKRPIYDEFKEERDFDFSVDEKQSGHSREISKENCIRLSNQNIFLDLNFAKSSKNPSNLSAAKNEELSSRPAHRKAYNHELKNGFSDASTKSTNTTGQKLYDNLFLSSFEVNQTIAQNHRKQLFESEELRAPHNSETTQIMTPFDAIDTQSGDVNRRILKNIRRKRDQSGGKRSSFISEFLTKHSDNPSKTKNPASLRSFSNSGHHHHSSKTVKTNNIFAYPASYF